MKLSQEILGIIEHRSTTLGALVETLQMKYPFLTKESIRVSLGALVSTQQLRHYRADGKDIFAPIRVSSCTSLTSLPELSLKEFKVLRLFYASPSQRQFGRTIKEVSAATGFPERPLRYFLEKCVSLGLLQKVNGFIVLYVCNTEEYEKVVKLLQGELLDALDVDTKVTHGNR